MPSMRCPRPAPCTLKSTALESGAPQSKGEQSARDCCLGERQAFWQALSFFGDFGRCSVAVVEECSVQVSKSLRSTTSLSRCPQLFPKDGSLVQMPPWANPYLIVAASISVSWLRDDFRLVGLGRGGPRKPIGPIGLSVKLLWKFGIRIQKLDNAAFVVRFPSAAFKNARPEDLKSPPRPFPRLVATSSSCTSLVWPGSQPGRGCRRGRDA